MSLEVLTVMHSENGHADAAMQREELVRRVASSVTFEKSPRLRAFFLHVCRCARENKSEEATEPQIAIYVYGRRPGYNPNEDNIVRSQARMLRMKLEHHFANEGKDEPVIISIPKGQYLPVFETRSKEAQIEPLHVQPRIVAPDDRKPSRFGHVLAGGATLFVLAVVWFGYLWFESRRTPSPSSVVPVASVSQPRQKEAEPRLRSQQRGALDARHRRDAFRGRSHGGQFCGHVGPPLGIRPLLRWRRFQTRPPAFLSPRGRQGFVQFHPGGCFG